jgi:hypothetical protein
VPCNVVRVVAVTADRGHLFKLFIVHQIGPREVTQIKQIAVDQLPGEFTMSHHRERLGMDIAVRKKPERPQLNVDFAVRRLAMINRQERNLGLDRDRP